MSTKNSVFISFDAVFNGLKNLMFADTGNHLSKNFLNIYMFQKAVFRVPLTSFRLQSTPNQVEWKTLANAIRRSFQRATKPDRNWFSCPPVGINLGLRVEETAIRWLRDVWDDEPSITRFRLTLSLLLNRLGNSVRYSFHRRCHQTYCFLCAAFRGHVSTSLTEKKRKRNSHSILLRTRRYRL